jgi:hypothetical protein
MMNDTQDTTNDIEQAGAEVGADQVQQQVDAEEEQGFRGEKVDPTPNEHYTVAGVLADKPTPETDAQSAQGAGSSRFNHLNEGVE